ncbi:MAG: 50S ribosomal protein L30 [Alphaproteobacteria bacterium]|jgi:large subunit ribosomal protein L30|nr:50S ribosomal protein L30 [Alphaproteobacteria bacterium]MDW2995502.1 50S ribosomal protein L30 [Alphaproteobacteria bacterium]
MAKIIVKQVKSVIGRPEAQVKIVKALGLGRVGKTKEITDSESARGMIAKVSHLVEVVK